MSATREGKEGRNENHPYGEYDKGTWKEGDVITATDLNTIEDGVYYIGEEIREIRNNEVELLDEINDKVDIDQGTSRKGYFVVVGSDGTITTVNGGIRTDISQSLTNNQKITARNNIDAASIENINKILNEIERQSDNVSQLEYLKERFFKIDSARLSNNNGEYLVDGSDKHMSGLIYLIKTDSTGTLDQVPMNAAMVGKTFLMEYEKTGLPVLHMEHPDILTLKRKSDGTISNVKIVCDKLGLNTKLKKLKVQGSSSQAYEKKNYTLTFSDDTIIKKEWGAHKKYVIKADWVDFSQMRNEIGAKIWGQVRKTRLNPMRSNFINANNDYLVDGNGGKLAGENDPCLSIGLNYGAIDAFPICVVINGTYWGLYSMTIPKDDWMANMKGENEHEGIVCAENHGLPTSFKELVNYPDEDGLMTGINSNDKGFAMEYASDDSNIDWMADSLNNLISSIMASYSTSQECLDNIGRYIDIDSAIDYYIFNCLIDNGDATDKNYLLDTWDGIKWYFATYDMDGTFGNNWDGKSYHSPSGGVTFANFRGINQLMQLIYTHNREALINRYRNLRQNVLSEENLINIIYNYSVNIPKIAFDYEGLRWPGRPGTNTNNYNQIINFLLLRCKFLDKEISMMQ